MVDFNELGEADMNRVLVRLQTGGGGVTPISLQWVRDIRDQTIARGAFFIKQLGSSHKQQMRVLDGRIWDEFPDGFAK